MDYLSKVAEQLKSLQASTSGQLTSIGGLIAEQLRQGGIIHLFGCGHSSLLAQEPFYRAGGLVPVRPITIEPLMLHQGAVQSSIKEKTVDFVNDYLLEEDIREGDVLIVISTSGRNPAPIDVALFGQKKGAYVIGLMSKKYASSQPSRHPSGKRLEQVVDVVIDTQVSVGDSMIEKEGIAQAFAPASSVIGTALIQALFAKTIVCFKELGEAPPIFLSGNIDGVEQHNQSLVEKYKDRIKF
ncbi:SIS domain-containing protein [Halobacillus shinanisalinarum]|uniref:SIS domain-containing protein n=1 Tax=Halobacillus shinanisalinarum TaxID=2932258 RepID=A0ABY4GY76_9BACI|nr:SIS domain-containing protein [Halobacillus shinanisalinarum]UOQ91732.1 SIS domain-containing protein [Halobacillus shinanisalinarum]